MKQKQFLVPTLNHPNCRCWVRPHFFKEDNLKTLGQLQKEVNAWSVATFGDNDHNFSKVTGLPCGSQSALTGVVEEVGEINHVVICSHQGRRGYDDPAKRRADLEDGVADLMIFLLDFCGRENIDLEAVLNNTWDKVVSKRNLQNWEQVSHDSPERAKAEDDGVNYEPA